MASRQDGLFGNVGAAGWLLRHMQTMSGTTDGENLMPEIVESIRVEAKSADVWRKVGKFGALTKSPAGSSIHVKP
jgi:hypothetical protein